MTDTVDPIPPSRTVTSGIVGIILVVVLGVAQLTWIGRPDRVDDLLVSFIGPFLGVGLGLWIGARFRRGRPPRKRSIAWHTSAAALLLVGWLLLVTATNGGLTTDAVVPLVVLGVLGTAALVAGVRLITPELVA